MLDDHPIHNTLPRILAAVLLDPADWVTGTARFLEELLCVLSGHGSISRRDGRGSGCLAAAAYAEKQNQYHGNASCFLKHCAYLID